MIVKLYLILYFFIPLLCYGDISFKIEGLDGALDYNVRKKLCDLHIQEKHIDTYLKKKSLMQLKMDCVHWAIMTLR